MKKIAVVLAGGRGSRMNSDIPKQYLMLKDRPVLYYALKAFQDSDIDSIVLAAGENDLEMCRTQIVEKYGINKVMAIVAGGVASNSALRAALTRECDSHGIQFYSPSPILCTDNAAMIGAAAYYEYMRGTRHGYDLNAVPNLKLGER